VADCLTSLQIKVLTLFYLASVTRKVMHETPHDVLSAGIFAEVESCQSSDRRVPKLTGLACLRDGDISNIFTSEAKYQNLVFKRLEVHPIRRRFAFKVLACRFDRAWVTQKSGNWRLTSSARRTSWNAQKVPGCEWSSL